MPKKTTKVIKTATKLTKSLQGFAPVSKAEKKARRK